MPLYEYQCLNCGNVFDKLSPRPEESARCPACGSERVERRISLFASTRSTRSVACAPTGG